MSEETILRRIIAWATFQPVWAAYRLVWLAAKSGNPDARDVYEAMWQANLALPPLTPEHRAQMLTEGWPEDEGE